MNFNTKNEKYRNILSDLSITSFSHLSVHTDLVPQMLNMIVLLLVPICKTVNKERYFNDKIFSASDKSKCYFVLEGNLLDNFSLDIC